jgi:hypothetical protein
VRGTVRGTGYRRDEEVEGGSGTRRTRMRAAAEGEMKKDGRRETETRSGRLDLSDCLWLAAGCMDHTPLSAHQPADLLRQCRRGAGFSQVRLQPASQFFHPPTSQRAPCDERVLVVRYFQPTRGSSRYLTAD